MSALPKLAAPAQRALASAGISSLEQLTQCSAEQLCQLHGMGPNALEKLYKALKSKGLSFSGTGSARKVGVKKLTLPAGKTDAVDAFMRALVHPLKREVQIIREIIKGVNPRVTEEIKWKAPSFSYKGEYLVTFNLRETRRVHLVFHNPKIPQVKSNLLEGDYKDRRMAYFVNMNDVKSNKATLEKALKDLIKLIGR